MGKYQLADLLLVTGGKLIAGDPACQIGSFSTQTDPPAREGCHLLGRRMIVPEKRLIHRLVSRGVRAVIAPAPLDLTPEKWSEAAIAVVEVPSMVTAIHKLAAFHRSHFDVPIIQVVGSSGKTTTKELIASVLRQKFPVLTNVGSHNSPIDAARTLLRLTDQHKAAVIETGMLMPGVIARSSRLLKPTYGVVTTVHRAHLLRMGSLEKIIAAKAELVPYVARRGALLINWENEHCRSFPLDKCPGRIIRFGLSPACDIWASNVRNESFATAFTVETKHDAFAVTLNTFGAYNVTNALAAAGIGLELGLSPQQIAAGMAAFRPVSRRLELIPGPHGITVVSDNYNANPDSTGQLLAALPDVVQGRPLVLVLGDLERPDDEVAGYARTVHRELGEQIAGLGPCRLIAIGKWAEEYVRGAVAKGFSPAEAFFYPTVEAAGAQFPSLVKPGSVVVFKAAVYTPVSDLMGTLAQVQPGS